MADDNPNAGDDGGAPSRDVPNNQLVLDLERLYNALIAPQVEAQERLRRATSGDIDSLAWWTADAPTSPAAAIRDLNLITHKTWTGDGEPIGPRLEEQLWNLHRGINDPDGGLNAIHSQRMKNLFDALWEIDSPQHQNLIKVIRELTDANNPHNAEITLDDLPPVITGDQPPVDDTGGWGFLSAIFGDPLKDLASFQTSPELGASRNALADAAAAATGGIVGAEANWRGYHELGAAVGLELEDGKLKLNPKSLADAFLSAVGTPLGALPAILEAIPSDDPEAVQKRAAAALTQALTFGLGAHATAVGLELAHPLKNMGLGQIAAFLADMAGFQPLSNALWSHLVSEAIDWPLAYQYREKFRSRIPPQGEVFAAARKWEFRNEEEFDGWIAKQGITPYWSHLMWRFIWADPRLTDIIRMADVSVEADRAAESDRADLEHYQVDPDDPDWWLDLKFKKAGYDRIDLKVLKKVVHARMVMTYLTRWRTQARESYRKGYWTVEQFHASMRENNVQADAIQLDIATTRLDRMHALGDEAIAEFRRQYLNDAMTEEEFRLGLDVWLDDTEVIENHVAAVNLQKRRSVAVAEDRENAAVIRKAQSELVTAYKEQYKRGLIDDTGLFDSLVAIGIHEEVARASVEVAKVRRLPVPKVGAKSAEQEAQEDARNILEDAYINQYRAGVIDDAGLLAALGAVGFHETVARAIVDREISRQVLAARRSAAAADAAATKATAAAEKATAAAAQREADKLFADLERRYLSLLVTQYDKGLIDEPTFLTRLGKAGWPEATAKTIVQREAARKKRDPSFVTDPPFQPRARGL